MAENIIGKIPEFTQDEALSETGQEVKEATTEEVVEEKETPEDSSTLEKPAETEEEVSEDSLKEQEELIRQNEGIKKEKEELLIEIQNLRQQRREIKTEVPPEVITKVEEIGDLNPNDVKVVEKILKAKGYITKEEATKLNYDTVKNEQLAVFLNKYPEFKPENDPGDIKWVKFQKELSYYKLPQDPHQIQEILERAKKMAFPVIQREVDATAERKIKTASLGGGVSKKTSSPATTLTQEQKEAYRRGGWTEDEIKEIEKRKST